jgi:hypothetical protein
MKAFLFLVLLFFSFSVLSHENNSNDDVDLRLLQEIDLQQGGTVFVTAREAGHILGQGFQIEVRVSCDGGIDDPSHLPVEDSFSVCDMDPDSLMVNKAGTAIAMKTKMAKVFSEAELLEKRNREFFENCSKKTEIKKFSLKKLCSNY